MKHFSFLIFFSLSCLFVWLPGKIYATEVADDDQAQAAPGTFGQLLPATQVIGNGNVIAYQQENHILLDIPPELLGMQLLWYAEAVSLPAGAVSNEGIETGTTIITMERHNDKIMVRNHSSGFSKRAGSDDQALPPGEFHTVQPIQASITDATKGPIIAFFPILAQNDNGHLLIDITTTFSGDIPGLSARPHIQAMGLDILGLAPERSYISKVKISPNDTVIRSHLTFMVVDPADPDQGEQPVSIEIGHSIIRLPAHPMSSRLFDSRVGFFAAKYTTFEANNGKAVDNRGVILRYRLEKQDPAAKISAPKKPIIFYVGQDVPERWRPYIKAGIEQWQPVFAAAGFSNAIIAQDAPSPKEAPDWAAENAHHNTIRWLAQAHPNAMGPVIYDPRTGEVMAAHIQVWPQVIEFFEHSYYGIASSLDPDAAHLPMAEQKQGELLQYIVAHEVGHALGLRHNHLASTAYSVNQLRDATFANEHGANSSIMAYGRFNQAAQPGDGISRIIPVIGPYDYFAIDWGYGIHGATAQEEKQALDKLAVAAQQHRKLLWAAGEMPDEIEKWGADPRLQRENVGAERLAATRLGVANTLRSLDQLDKACGNDAELYASTYKQLGQQQLDLVMSVASLVGGLMPQPASPGKARYLMVPTTKQKAAVNYLLNEAPLTFEPYKQPEQLLRVQAIGGLLAIEQAQGNIVSQLLTGTRLTLLANQKALKPASYGVIEFCDDIFASLWGGDLTTIPRWRRFQQKAFMAKVKEILLDQRHGNNSDDNKMAMVATGFSQAFSSVAVAQGGETLFPAWARARLPELHNTLANASQRTTDPELRLHLQDMAWQIEQLVGN